MEINKKENYCSVPVNTKIYPLEVIYSAAYAFIDKAYILLDGDVKNKVNVQLRPKKKYSLEKLGMEFNNELLNYANYRSQAELNGPIRQALIQKALFTNDPDLLQETNEDLEDLGLEELDDISIPWEEKYSDKDKKKSKARKK